MKNKKNEKREKRNTNIAVVFAMSMAAVASVMWTKLIVTSKYKDKLKLKDEQIEYSEAELNRLEKKCQSIHNQKVFDYEKEMHESM